MPRRCPFTATWWAASLAIALAGHAPTPRPIVTPDDIWKGAAAPVEHPVTAAAPVGPVDSFFNSLGGPAPPPREKKKESKHWKRIQHEPIYKQPAVLVASSGGVGTTMLLRRLRDRGITTNHPTDADGLKHAQYPPDMPSVTHAIYLFGDPVQAHASLQRRNMLENSSP